jgi:membrane peptidoglycan carboxypeptidase
MKHANTLTNGISPSSAVSERKCGFASHLSLSALNAGTLAERLFEIPRLRWKLKGPPRWLLGLLLFLAVAWAVAHELRTSALQSRFFSYWASHINYTVAPGASPSIVFPQSGPFDSRLGYSQIPDFQRRLANKGFVVAEQARFSPVLQQTARWGITPPYRESASAGLAIRSAEDLVLYETSAPGQLFQTFDEIPPLVVKTLLFMENRELAPESVDVSANPVVEWGRLAKAGISYAGSKLGLKVRLEGGSTLATQLEKYRHSPGGRTASAVEKLRQITGASLRVYRSGTNTRTARREIILDYLNTVPLAAAPGYGEVNGLGQGLQAWFGVSLQEVQDALRTPATTPDKVQAFKQALTLLAAVRAPSSYLHDNRSALEARVLHYVRLMAASNLIDATFASEVERAPITFPAEPYPSPSDFSAAQKTSNSIRTDLMELLEMSSLYDLDRLDLEVKSTIDGALQREIAQLFEDLRNPRFLEAKGLRQERLLSQGDPGNVIYSLLLFEKSPQGNLLRVQTDSLEQPLDINEGIKLELGSTAKLRTLAHYLELVSELYSDRQMSGVTKPTRDPITSWTRETLKKNPQLRLDELLQLALDRTYSASPYEGFFTGGGLHAFSNFDSRDNGRTVSIREATWRSTNLVFIRLMRDIVRFHQARLPYDAEAVLARPENPVRQRLLDEAAEAEDRQILFQAYKNYRGLSPEAMTERLLGTQAKNPRHMTIAFLAWNPGPHEDLPKALAAWLKSRGITVVPEEIERLVRAYGNPRLNLKDYGYLIGRHPLEVWCIGDLLREPSASWTHLWERSQPARRIASSWLYQTRHRRAQDIRLRTRIEQDAFARMTPYWRRLGFPFERLIPSFATAIGNSSDRPAALAELMGIILNDGQHRPVIRLEELRFAQSTPYHTVIKPSLQPADQVMPSPVAQALKTVLAGVVKQGTARRLAEAFSRPDGTPIIAGGKTGSGDNRFKSFGRDGSVLSSRAVNRTATFAFYVSDRYFGVISASVLGKQAEGYRFTSALPVAILKLLAPALNQRLTGPGLQPA